MNTSEAKRVLETALICAQQPLPVRELRSLFDGQLGADTVRMLLDELARDCDGRGIELVCVAGGWRYQSRPEMHRYLERMQPERPPRYSRAVLETLAIIAYHQPVTRAEIEDIRGVTMSRGTLDILLEIGWIKMRGRKRVPGRPVTYGTTDAFLMHFGLDKVSDLPGLEELRAAGLLEGRIPAAFMVPTPSDSLAMDEDPLEAGDSGETFEPETPDPKDGD